MDLGREVRRHGSVVMAGDWNVSRSMQDTHPRLRTEEPHARARAELNARIAADGFVDIWRERHPMARAHAWFNRRARRLCCCSSPVRLLIARAWLDEQRSQSNCIQGETWGFQGNGIWVTDGCSGVFAFQPQ